MFEFFDKIFKLILSIDKIECLLKLLNSSKINIKGKVMDSVRFFSQKRLSSYKDENEHKDNFLLIQKITPNLGIIEIVTRNIVASLLNFEDNQFISKQTFGFWAKTLDEEKIHNKIVNLDRLEFKKYSHFNKKDKLLNYQKVKIVYNLLTTVRNRAFHFENLYKLNQNFTPRISTKVGKTLVGIDPKNLEEFIIDILDCFDENLKKYIKKGG